VGMVTGYGGDGGLATRARLGLLGGLALDQHQNVLVADNLNNRVRMIAAISGAFYGIAMIAGDIYTVAGNGSYGYGGDGGPATSAELRDPQGVSVDGAGNLLISDTLNSRVRLVAATSGTYYGEAVAAGDVATVAGSGRGGFLGDSGPATGARLNYPAATGVDGTGNLLIVDDDNGRVREVSGSAPESNR